MYGELLPRLSTPIRKFTPHASEKMTQDRPRRECLL